MFNLRRAADPAEHDETELSTISVFGLYTVSVRTVVGDMGEPLELSSGETETATATEVIDDCASDGRTYVA